MPDNAETREAPKCLITIQVFVDADAQEAENVAVHAADYITESFSEQENATIQTVFVHGGPFTYTESGLVFGRRGKYDGDEKE